MTELETTPDTAALAVSGEQDYWNPTQLATLRHMGVENATDGDLRVFHHVCQRTGLDPFAKQIYMISRQNSERGNDGEWRKVTKWTIQTGIDGFRLVARRASDRLHETLEYEDTLWCDRDGNWTDVWVRSTPPAAAKVTVLRHGKRFPAVASYAEYVQTKSNGDPNAMWKRMPSNQLAKCAEALALRKAFPHDLSGIYTDDEMGQADYVRGEVVESDATTAAADRLRNIIATQTPPTEPVVSDNPERDALLEEIKTAASAAGVKTEDIAKDWAEAHEGQRIIEATDIGGLELLRDDLMARSSS